MRQSCVFIPRDYYVVRKLGIPDGEAFISQSLYKEMIG